jgi:cob(I)alamin adenosyltransferase
MTMLAPTYISPMDSEAQARRVRSFLLGGLVGASAALSVARRQRRRRDRRPAGLAAFEGAPCQREARTERDRRA